ncbi:MAG TPA: chitosanase [Solirubrobacteraceae bacterium]|nr:chitosanase [Solirubrobacteraceae bacterium]
MPRIRAIAVAVTTVSMLAVPAAATPLPGARSHRPGLEAPREREIAMELVSSAENSTLNWRREYGYIQDIGDGRGYTAGLIGFCSGTGDMLALVRSYVRAEPLDPLARFLPALRQVDGTASHRGLGRPFVRAWRLAAHDQVFRRMQLRELDRVYFDPAVRRAKRDGLSTLGQFIYYDAIVMHGPGDGYASFGGIRRRAMERARTPAQGGSQVRYLNAFLDVRRALMKRQRGHHNTSRIDDEQRVFLRERKFALRPPLIWHTYGDRYEIRAH